MPAILHAHLIELDFSGIEAVLVGWFARDPQYIRLAKLGVHAYVTSHVIGRPADLALPDDELALILKALKKQVPYEYDQCKRVVHGTGYGMTPHGMHLMFPQYFPTLKAAQHVQGVYFRAAPRVKTWQGETQQRAHDQTYLGGPPRPGFDVLSDPNAHPYGYRHDFYGVLSYRPIATPGLALKLRRQHVPIVEMNGREYQIVLGEDAKSCIAFYPQSTAAGILKDVCLRLFDAPDSPSYIGDAYFGRTPLRAPIHDSLLLEVPPRQSDRVLLHAFGEMLRPIAALPLLPEWAMGTHLQIGVEGKIGLSWDKMGPLEPPAGVTGAVYSDALALDRLYTPATEAEEEDVEDLAIPYWLEPKRAKVAV